MYSQMPQGFNLLQMNPFYNGGVGAEPPNESEPQKHGGVGVSPIKLKCFFI